MLFVVRNALKTRLTICLLFYSLTCLHIRWSSHCMEFIHCGGVVQKCWGKYFVEIFQTVFVFYYCYLLLQNHAGEMIDSTRLFVCLCLLTFIDRQAWYSSISIIWCGLFVLLSWYKFIQICSRFSIDNNKKQNWCMVALNDAANANDDTLPRARHCNYFPIY